MDLSPLLSQFAQASPVFQAALTTLALFLVFLSTWFWSVTLDRLFDSIGARRSRNRAAAAGGRS